MYIDVKWVRFLWRRGMSRKSIDKNVVNKGEIIGVGDLWLKKKGRGE